MPLWDSVGNWLAGGDNGDPLGRRKQSERRVRAAAGEGQTFGKMGQEGYGQRGGQIDESVALLQRLARGEESFSAEQLRQGLQQNLAGQQSMAAGARPANQAMAARTAAIQSGRLGSGLAGQQALAGIAERQAANDALGRLLLGARGQDVQAALGGYGINLQGQADILNAQYGLAGIQAGQPSQQDKLLGMAGSAFGSYAVSDERKKLDIRNDGAAADQLLRTLSPTTYTRAPGAPRELGIIAQNVEQSPAGQNIVGQMEDGTKAFSVPKMVGGLAAGVGRLNERLANIENKMSPSERSTADQLSRRTTKSKITTEALPPEISARSSGEALIQQALSRNKAQKAAKVSGINESLRIWKDPGERERFRQMYLQMQLEDQRDKARQDEAIRIQETAKRVRTLPLQPIRTEALPVRSAADIAREAGLLPLGPGRR